MNGTKKKKNKSLKKKKVLLSIVDPWDVKVASVDPICLHERRGISLSDIPTSTNNGSQFWPSSKSPVKIPSPWYKPGNSSSSLLLSDNRKPFESHSACDLKSIPRPTIGLRQDLFSSDGTFKPNTAIKDNNNTKIDTNCTIGFEDFANLNITPRDTSSRVRFENSIEDYCDNNNERPTNINGKLKTNFKNNQLKSIVQELVESRYTPTSSHCKRSRRLLSSQTPFKIDHPDENILLTPFNEIEIITSNSRTSETSENSTNSPSTTETIGLGSKIRKTSMSMPSKLDDMDDLRINHQKLGEHTLKSQGVTHPVGFEDGFGVPSKFSRPESDSSTTFSNSGSTPNESQLCSETEDEENDEKFSKIPVQPSPRRKSISPAANQKLGNENLNLPGAPSPHSTITSVNSIQSLLKEKFQLSLPQALRNSKQRQNADYRLRAFVGMLFLCIVFLVGFAYAYYNTHVLQRAYFDRFRFNNNERLMHIYNRAGSEIIAARLGLGISSESGVFECLPQHRKRKSVCLEWLDQTRLYLSHGERDSMDCYKFIWQSLSPSFNPKDCFDWSHNRGHWYGGGQIQNMAYPLEQGKLDLSPFITGDIQKHPFGNVLKRYFLNSKGATILVDPDTPLYVSINANRTKEFCLQAKYDNFAYINHPTPLPSLSYSICATDNMKNLHSTMAEKTLWDGLTPDELHAVHTLLTEPVWQISPTNEAAIYNYTEDVILLGFLRQGHVLLSEEWQAHPGDFVLDETRFPSMEETINIMHRRGFRIVFSIQPFISTESQNFQDAVTNRLLISERGSDPRIPALTRYKNISSAGVLDITNNKTLPWLMSKLENLISKYHVDSFYLDIGTAHDMPQYYKCEYPLTNPDHYKTIFSKAILNSVPVIGVSGAISRPKAPVFVSLPPFPSSWKAIKTVIPTILSYGMIGYPFIMPGAVGGDVALPMSDNNPDNDFEVSLPDKELYVRWLQLSTFLPVIRFTHLPSKYADSEVLDMARQLTILRQKTVTPLLKKYANNTLDTGLPIIRPLWMLDPTDPACHVVVDEFSVGEELIVAPILYSGSRQREVYLPAGVWRDGIDGSLRKGSRWIHNYKVRDVQIAYFVKMPDNTRF
ncbi:myogenesis-regulating glycosidase isoform X3 [Leptopilina heterotoma]|uniref:myogenesis-regulating glycosidase isoform X3 n=1 Tax=Leptopilina heterotoma TaxID=63436 RepID=UPI001CA9C917|nr:myogenesis-regulating glycosidase isoform X3 [Leptopilina heterotoma]